MAMAMATYTYKFRLRPSTDQASRISRNFGVCRFVYNHFLEQRKSIYESTGSGSNFYRDCAALTKLKKELPWIRDAIAQSLQRELKNLDTSFIRFFKGQSRFPRFHSKRRDRDSFGIPQDVRVSGGRVFIPKFKDGIRIEQHRPVEGKIGSATISRNRAGQYFVCVNVERQMPRISGGDSAVGVDLGLKTLATCSNGVMFENVRPRRNLSIRLRRAQRSMSRKISGSNNHTKARLLLAKIHQRISDIRVNHLHLVSKSLVNDNQVIVLEDLNVSGMMARHSLAGSVADASLGELVRQIEYKSRLYGRNVIKISRWYPSSKTCSSCGHVNQGLTLSDRTWTCTQCNQDHSRDLNASLNILAEGLRKGVATVGTTGIACGESVSLPSGSDSR